VFRARCLAAVTAAGLHVPDPTPARWVVNRTSVGKGLPALQYLSRYLYRGVIAAHHIVANSGGKVTFRYLEAGTGEPRYRTLEGPDFLWLVLQQVLPKSFRRVRDYGFPHGNAEPLRSLVQLVLHVLIESAAPRPRPAFKCPACRSPMRIVGFLRPAWQSG